MKNLIDRINESKVKYNKNILKDTVEYINSIDDNEAKDFIYDLLSACDEQFPRNAVHVGVQNFVNAHPNVMKERIV